MVVACRYVAAAFFLTLIFDCAPARAQSLTDVRDGSSASLIRATPELGPLGSEGSKAAGFGTRMAFGVAGGLVAGALSAGVFHDEDAAAAGYFLGTVAGISLVNKKQGDARLLATALGAAIGALPYVWGRSLNSDDPAAGLLTLFAVVTIPLGGAVASSR